MGHFQSNVRTYASFAGLLSLVDGQGLSRKARKLAQTNLQDNLLNAMFGEQDPTTTTTTTEDPFADFDTAFESTVTEDPFFSFDDDPFFNGGGGPLPPCTELSMVRYSLINDIELFKSYSRVCTYHRNLSDTI